MFPSALIAPSLDGKASCSEISWRKLLAPSFDISPYVRAICCSFFQYSWHSLSTLPKLNGLLNMCNKTNLLGDFFYVSGLTSYRQCFVLSFIHWNICVDFWAQFSYLTKVLTPHEQYRHCTFTVLHRQVSTFYSTEQPERVERDQQEMGKNAKSDYTDWSIWA